MKKRVFIIRIDPFKRTIARMPMSSGKSVIAGTREAKRIIRAETIGMRQILELEPHPLMVAGRLDVDEAMPGWRFRGSEETAGVSFLFGKGPGGGIVDVPVDVDWVKRRIQWLDNAYDEPNTEAGEGDA